MAFRPGRSTALLVLAAWLAGAGAAEATPGPPVARIDVVDAECRPVREVPGYGVLRVTYGHTAQSCAGGRCHPILDEALDASELELWVEGCSEPLGGRFHRGEKTCGGRPVWIWTGGRHTGRRHEVKAWPYHVTTALWIGGPKMELRCPTPSRPVPVGDSHTVEPFPHTRTAWLPLASFRFYGPIPDAPGRTGVGWDVGAALPHIAEKGRFWIRSPGFSVPGRDPWAGATRRDGEVSGELMTQQRFTRQGVELRGHPYCETRASWTVVFTVPGTELRFAGSQPGKPQLVPGTCKH